MSWSPLSGLKGVKPPLVFGPPPTNYQGEKPLTVFLLLSVPWWFLEGFDDQGRSRRYHLNLGLSVLNGQFHCNPQSLPATSCLGDVITDLFWRQTEGLLNCGVGEDSCEFLGLQGDPTSTS